MSLFNKAADLFQRFHGRAPKTGDVITIKPQTGEVQAILVGELVAVAYKTKEHKRAFFHRFEKRRPLLFVSADGTQAYILRGAYRFTSRGFVG